MISETAHPSPLTSSYEPVLTSDGEERNGAFIYSTSHQTGATPAAATVEEGSANGHTPIADTVGFVFKIETENVTAFIWKVKIVDFLDMLKHTKIVFFSSGLSMGKWTLILQVVRS